MINFDRVLYVDDQKSLLAAAEVNLRHAFDVHTAGSGAEGLQRIKHSLPFPVIISDMHMPEMNGIEFLSQVQSVSPDSVRIMLTSDATQQTAVSALNTGVVDRFLNKPCEPSELVAALSDAAEEYRRRTIEKDLLEKTFQASVDVLVETLSLANPAAFGRSARFADLALKLAESMGLEQTWAVRSAALLSQIGCINLPDDLLSAVTMGLPVSDEEWNAYVEHVIGGADLIEKIPRLGQVALGIRYQYKNYDGTGMPADDLAGGDLPQLARILRVVLEVDRLTNSGEPALQVLEHIRTQAQYFDPQVVAALETVLPQHGDPGTQRVSVDQLQPDMMLAEDVLDRDGVLLVCSGWDASATVIEHLKRAVQEGLLEDSVLVQTQL